MLHLDVTVSWLLCTKGCKHGTDLTRLKKICLLSVSGSVAAGGLRDKSP